MTRQGNNSDATRPRLRVPMVIIAIAVIIAACGGGEASTSTEAVNGVATTPATVGGQTATNSDDTAAPSGSTDTTAASSPDEPDPDAQLAPDFTLELGEGGEFVLSAEPKPVYLVFWAEW